MSEFKLPEGYSVRVRTVAPTKTMGEKKEVLQVIRPDGTALSGKFDTDFQAIRAAQEDKYERDDAPFKAMFIKLMNGEDVKCPQEGCEQSLVKQQIAGGLCGACPVHGNQTKGPRVGP